MMPWSCKATKQTDFRFERLALMSVVAGLFLFFKLGFGDCTRLNFIHDVHNGGALIGRTIPDSAAIVITDPSADSGQGATIWQRVQGLVQVYASTDTPAVPAPHARDAGG